MKNLFVVSLLVVVGAFAQAQGKKVKSEENVFNKTTSGADRIDGCGLGWQVTSDRTMLATTTRGTTNAFVPPSFGMTSGTIGCDQIKFAKKDQEAAAFVATNYQTLKSDLAVGQGEYVEAMIESFGCSASQAPAISSEIQKNYDRVVAPAQNATELFHNLKTEIHCG